MRRADFQRVYGHGGKVVGCYVVVFALARAGGEKRLGVTATRRVGGAVVRNRARRRVRELFRLHLAVLGEWRGDLVVNVRQGCAKWVWGELEKDYLRCLGRLSLRPISLES